jgi:hypothetical protein
LLETLSVAGSCVFRRLLATKTISGAEFVSNTSFKAVRDALLVIVDGDLGHGLQLLEFGSYVSKKEGGVSQGDICFSVHDLWPVCNCLALWETLSCEMDRPPSHKGL